MLMTIKEGSDAGCITPQLCDMLGPVHEIGPDLSWSVVDIYCVLNVDSGYTIADVERNVEASGYGWAMSWDKLLRFSDALKEAYDCFVVGYLPGSKGVSVEMNRTEMLEAMQVGIEMFDSTMWIVYCRDEHVGHGYARTFDDVTKVDGGEPSGRYL